MSRKTELAPPDLAYYARLERERLAHIKRCSQYGWDPDIGLFKCDEYGNVRHSIWEVSTLPDNQEEPMIANLKPIPADAPARFSRWVHWKGQCIAHVEHVSYHTETSEFMVDYLEEKSGLYFSRPLSMWGDTVATGAKRFRPMTQAELKAEADAKVDQGIADRELFYETMRDADMDAIEEADEANFDRMERIDNDNDRDLRPAEENR